MKCKRTYEPVKQVRSDWRFFEPIPDAADPVPRHFESTGRRWGVDVVSPNIDGRVGGPALPNFHIRRVRIFKDLQDVLGRWVFQRLLPDGVYGLRFYSQRQSQQEPMSAGIIHRIAKEPVSASREDKLF